MKPIDLIFLLQPPANDHQETSVTVAVQDEGEPCPFADIDGKPCDAHRYDGCAWGAK